MHKNNRKAAAGHLVRFLLFMLFCTMVSRGIYAYRMPRVAVGQVSAKSISHTFSVEGSVEPGKEEAVVLTEGIRIREVCVKTGERVEKGTVLLVLDEDDLKDMAKVAGEKIKVSQERLRDFGKNSLADQSSLIEEQYALAHLQKQQKDYHRLLEEKGRIRSKKDGYVTEIFVKAGDRTPDCAVMLYAVLGQWLFRSELAQEQADLVKAGDTVQLQFQDGRIQEKDCPVASVTRTGQGTYEAVVQVTESSLSPGENGTMEATGIGRQYTCCVPVSAIYSDGDKNYILLIRETDTILGTELTVARRDVVVADQNETMAALEDGMLGAEEAFVVYADKEPSAGDKVRLFEEEDKLK